VAVGVVVSRQDEVVLELGPTVGACVLLDHPPEVAALEARLEDEDVVVPVLGQVVGEGVEVVRGGVDVLGVGRGVLAVVDDGIDEVLGEDDRLHLALERLLEDVVLGQVDRLVGVVGGVQFGLRGQEDIVRDAA
jgi:hypothetical protein